MRILVILPDNPPKKVLIELSDRQQINRIKNLVNRKKHSMAVEIALQKGRLEREVGADEFENLSTDLVLRVDSAHWDRVGEK